MNFAALPTHLGSERVLIPRRLSALLIGSTLVTNLRGGVAAVAVRIRERKPPGVDCSRSVLTTTGSVRLFGAFLTLVGAGMTYAGVAHP